MNFFRKFIPGNNSSTELAISPATDPKMTPVTPDPKTLTEPKETVDLLSSDDDDSLADVSTFALKTPQKSKKPSSTIPPKPSTSNSVNESLEASREGGDETRKRKEGTTNTGSSSPPKKIAEGNPTEAVIGRFGTSPLQLAQAKMTREIILSNKTHPWVGKEVNQLGFPTIPSLTITQAYQIMASQYYGVPNKVVQTRVGPQCANIETILASRFLWCLPNALPEPDPNRGWKNPDNPYVAIKEFERLASPECNRYDYGQQRRLMLRYYHPVASITVPSDLLNDTDFFVKGKGARSLRSWKLNMASFIIITFLHDISGVISESANLDSYRLDEEDRPVFYCLILPVVHTMVMMMDNEDKTNLSVNKILRAKPGSWIKRIKQQISQFGCWSYHGLKEHKGQTRNVAGGNRMAQGVHYTVARVVKLLSLDKDRLGGLGATKLWLTNGERQDLDQNINRHVVKIEKERDTV